MIEPGAAELAARKAKPEDIVRLRDAFNRMARAVGGEGSYTDADLAFHQGILQAAHNQFLSQLSPVIGAVLRLSFELSTTSLESARSSLPNHAAVLQAVASGDAVTAHDRVVDIIIASRGDMEAILSDRSVTPPQRIRERS